MTQISRRFFLVRNSLLPVYSAAKISQIGDIVVIPKYCHFDQKIFPLIVITPASKTDIEHHVANDNISNTNVTLPGLRRRFQVNPAENIQSAVEKTNAIAKPGN